MATPTPSIGGIELRSDQHDPHSTAGSGGDPAGTAVGSSNQDTIEHRRHSHHADPEYIPHSDIVPVDTARDWIPSSFGQNPAPELLFSHNLGSTGPYTGALGRGHAGQRSEIPTVPNVELDQLGSGFSQVEEQLQQQPGDPSAQRDSLRHRIRKHAWTREDLLRAYSFLMTATAITLAALFVNTKFKNNYLQGELAERQQQCAVSVVGQTAMLQGITSPTDRHTTSAQAVRELLTDKEED